MLKRIQAPWIVECDTLPTGTADEARRVRTLRAFLLIILAIVNLFSLPLALSSAEPGLALLLMQPINLAILAACYLLRRRQIDRAVVVFLASVWSCITAVAILLQGGVSSLAVCAYMLVILAAGLFLGLRKAVFFTLVCVISLLGLYFGAVSGHIRPALTPHSPQEAMFMYGLVFVSGLVLIGTAINGMQSALRRAQSHENSLREKNLQLQDLLDDLEQRIRDRAGAILEQKQFYEALVENSPIAIVTLDSQHRVQSCNPAFESLFGYTREETLGNNLDDLIATPSTWEQATGFTRQALAGQTVRATASRRRRDGSLIDVDIYGVPVLVNGSQIGILGMYHDITEQVQAETHLKHLATHDPLTDLSNRAMFYDHMEHALAMAHRSQERVAVLFLDLDGFKAVNDLLGHWKGDLLLQQVADRLKTTLRASDLLARLGGDEFAFVCEGIRVPEDAAAIAEKILRALEKPYLVEGQAMNISGSIGISLYPEDGGEPKDLLRCADAAMYRVKGQGKAHFQFFSRPGLLKDWANEWPADWPKAGPEELHDELDGNRTKLAQVS